MPELVIHQEIIDAEAAKALIDLCPFNAFAYQEGELTISPACRMCRLCVQRGPAGAVEYRDEAPAGGEPADKRAWSGIAVYAEQFMGRVAPVVLELLGKARALASAPRQPVQAILIGSCVGSAAEELLRYGADEVFVYDAPELLHFNADIYTALLEDCIRKARPSSVLVGATNLGRSLAPRAAARFATGLTADCTALEMRANTDLVQIRPAFGGNIMAEILTPQRRPQFCTVRHKVFAASAPGEPTGRITAMPVPPRLLATSVTILGVRRREAHNDISEAEGIVAVGRGIRGEKEMEYAKQLADRLGAQLACTRPLVEDGRFDAKRQIGLSGRTVQPKILVALGISGAVQFTAGMRGSGCILAVNRDRSAPIFDIAHHGFVGDLAEMLPLLLRRIDAIQDNGGISHD